MRSVNKILILFFTFVNINAQECKSTIQINTNETGSYIFINDTFIGNGNVITMLDSGKYEVYIKRFFNKWNNYEITDTIHTTECNKTYTFNYELKDNFLTCRLVQFTNNTVNTFDNFYKEDLKESNWIKILISTSVILGATAAYFKISADKRYDEYISTGDKEILRKVKKLDFYSGIAFGLMQINFGYLVYKFLLE